MARTAQSRAPERYAAVAFRSFGAGADEALILEAGGDSFTVAPAAYASLLGQCGSFDGLDAHAERIAGSLAASDEHEAIRASLEELASAGFLVGERVLLRGWQRQARSVPAPPPIELVTVTTRDAPELLARCVRSYLAALESGGRARRVELAVFDDSPSAAMRRRNRACLRELARGTRARLSYAGLEEKRRFAAALARQAQVAPEVALSAIVGAGDYFFAAGANRNGALLHGAGRLTLEADHDTIAALVTPPEAQPGLDLALDDPEEGWFLEEAEGQAALARPAAELLQLHERLLGRELGQLVSAASAPIAFKQAGPRAFLGGAGGRRRVALTRTGYVGDSGTASVTDYLLVSGATRDRLLASDDAGYRRAFRSRSRLEAARRTTVSVGRGWRGPHSTALDLRSPLAPFPPEGFGERAVMAALARSSDAGIFFGHLAAAIVHAPPQARQLGAAELRAQPMGVPYAVLLLLLAGETTSQEPGRPSPAAAIIGAHLQQIAQLPAEELTRHLRRHAAERQSGLLARARASLAGAGERGAAWRRDLDGYAAALEHSLSRPGLEVPHDLRLERDPEAAMRRFRRMLAGYGRLVAAWPELMGAAQALRARGVALAKPVRR